MESNLQKYSVYMMSILIHVAMPKSSYNMGILHVICLISLMLCAKLFGIYSGGSRGGALGAYSPPFKNSKKNDFLAIFEDFWTIKQFLYALHY